MRNKIVAVVTVICFTAVAFVGCGKSDEGSGVASYYEKYTGSIKDGSYSIS